MNVAIAVSAAVARSRPGLLEALQASGFLADEPADLFAWAERPGRSAIILSLSSGDVKKSRLPVRGSRPHRPVRV